MSLKRSIPLSLRAPIMCTAIFMIAGCASSLPVPPVRPFKTQSEVFDYPAIGQLANGELGQTLIDKGITHYGLVCDLKEEVQFLRTPANREFLPPQTLIAHAEDDLWIYYHAQSRRHKNAGDFGLVRSEEGMLKPVGLRISKDQTKVEAYFWWQFLTYVPILPPKFEIRKTQTSIHPSFRQQLIYNGRSGNTLKFLYREISSDFMRPAFTQDIQYDISSSRVVGFKGARLEILQASNEGIQYRLISPFRD